MQEEREIIAPPAGSPPVGAADTMRSSYRALNQTEQSDMAEVKRMGNEFCRFLSNLGASRELSIAKTKIEEAVMWAVKDITG